MTCATFHVHINRDHEVKNTGRCPKCESADIFRVPGWAGNYGAGNYIIAGTGWLLPKKAKVARYVCTQCGFCEEWVDEEKELEKVKQQHQKIATSS